MSSNDVTTRLAAVFARSLPLMFVCPLILCNTMDSPSRIVYWSAETTTMSAIQGL